jgi:hypothetical protein
VVFAEKLVIAVDDLRAVDSIYWQVDVALGEARAAAPQRLGERDAAIEALRGPRLATLLAPVKLHLDAEPVVAADLVGPATIGALSVRGDVAGVTLEASWDDAPVAVSVPLALLGPPPLRLAMPFASRALIRLRATAPADVEVAIEGEPGLPAAPWGHLFSEVHETRAPASAPHPVAALVGPGRLAGVCARLEGHGDEATYGAFASPFNFLEGDERIVVDGRVLQGTGTEDFFDSAFYFAGAPFTRPFAAAWDVAASERARVSACRWLIAGGAIDFSSCLEMDLEIGPGDPGLLDRYVTVALYYR